MVMAFYLTIPLKITEEIASILSILPSGEYTINQIKYLANLHWETVKNYLELIEYTSDFTFKLKLVDDNNQTKIILQNKYTDDLYLDDDVYILIYLYLGKAYSEQTAIKINMRDDLEDYLLYN